MNYLNSLVLDYCRWLWSQTARWIENKEAYLDSAPNENREDPLKSIKVMSTLGIYEVFVLILILVILLELPIAKKCWLV